MMKKLYFALLLVSTTFMLGVLPLSAQQPRERVVIRTADDKAIGFWADNVKEISVLHDTPDLSTTLDIEPSKNVAGQIAIGITIGSDVKDLRLFFLEKHMVKPEMLTPEGIVKTMNMLLANPNPEIPVHKVNIPLSPEITANGLQQGYSYYAFLVPFDEYGCVGEPQYKDFELPKVPLKGQWEGKVSFSNVEYNSLTFTVEMAPEGKGFFTFISLKNDPTLDQMMQMLGVPDLKHYVVAFGTDFKTKKMNTKKVVSNQKSLVPNTEYVVYVVWVDKDGQYSDVKEYPITTKQKGTDKESNIAVEVKDITAEAATLVCKPDVNTSLYRYYIIEKAKYNEADLNKLLAEPDTPSNPIKADNDTWTWHELTADTEYYAVARGKNALGQWGRIALVPFKTLKK